MRVDIGESRDNKYLNEVLTDINFGDITRQGVLNNMKKVNKLFENKGQLDFLYELSITQRTKGEKEWYNITKSLNKVYQFLTSEWVSEINEGYNPTEDFSKIFEALVYQVLRYDKNIKLLKYEPEILIEGYKVTPDFIINNDRIVEVKLSKNGAFKNESKYRKFDSNLIKVYLSKEQHKIDFDKGGCCSIITLIEYVENNIGYELNSEREMANRMMKSMHYVMTSNNKLTFEKRNDVLFKTEALRAQIKAILRSINKNK